MAVNWYLQKPPSVADYLKKRVLPACGACVLLVVGVNALNTCGVDPNAHKIRPNQIVSPWDKSQVPAALSPSPVVAIPESQKPKPQVIVNSHTRRHYSRRHYRRD